MAGEVKSQLTITLQGGVGASGGGAPSSPVARRSELLSSGQSMSNFAAGRQQRFSQQIAMEIARDKEAARELQRALVRSEAEDIASAVRSAEAREAFADRVRGARGSSLDDAFGDQRVGRRALRSGAAASKRLLRGWGTGVAAGFGTQAFLPGDDTSAFGIFSRIGLTTVSGGAWGGAPGAVGAFFTAVISELVKAVSEGNKDTESLRRAIAELAKDLRQAIEDSELRMQEFRQELEKKFEVEINRIELEAQFGYREERFHRSTLVQ